MEIQLRVKHLSIIAAILCVLAVGLVSLVPGSIRSHTGLASELEHVIAYAAVGVLLLAALPWTIWIAGFLVFLVASSEIAQIWIPGRDAAFLDFLAGCLGIAIAVAIQQLVVWYRRRFDV